MFSVLSSDRTPDARIQHKEQVHKLNLKEGLTLGPHKIHFIKSGQIFSVDDTVSDITGQ